MFDPTTDELYREVIAAIEETAQQTDPAQDIVRRYTGRWYRKDHGEQDPDPENFGYSFLSNILPQLAIDNPSVSVSASRVVGHALISQAMDDGINAVIQEADWTEIHLPVLAEFCLCRGVTLHFIKEDARFSRGSVTPAVKRVPCARFFQDSLAEDPDEDEFRGHWFYADLNDLLNDERVNKEALATLSPLGQGDEGTPQTKATKTYPKKSASDLGRKRIKVYSVWLRHKNVIRVLAEGSKVVELYDETPYWGEQAGPYQLYDAYPVPGQCWPLSPLIAVEDQVQDLNIHARAMGRSAARRKSIGLVEANNPDLGDKLTDAEDGEIMAVKGITGNHVIIEVGGVTPQQYTITEYLRQRLDRISGMTATIQGSVGDANTATEAAIADSALSNRIGFLRNRVIKATERSLRKVAWFLFHTEGIIIPVNRRDQYSGEQLEGLFFGGPWPTDQGATWDDFSLRIMPFSMQRESEQGMQARTLGYLQIFYDAMERAPSMPWVRWMNLLRDVGQAFQMEDKADEWVIPEIFGAFSQPQQFPPSQLMQPPGVGQRPGGPPYRSKMGQPKVGPPGPADPGGGFSGGAGKIGGNGIANGPSGPGRGGLRIAG